MGITHDVKYIVELASKVKSLAPKVCFVIFGEGAEHDAIVSRASQLQILGESVHVLPEIPKADIGGVLSVATAGISTMMPIPELEANSANKFFDYLAAGKPVVINYGGWQQALLEDTGAGIRLDYADLDKAAADLVAFISDPNALNKRSDAANELARSRFSRDDLANQLIQILEKQALDMATSSAGIGE
jgi:glycosyltransferase involved in cell wall biosynthesis